MLVPLRAWSTTPFAAGFAEFVGTFALIFIGMGSIVFAVQAASSASRSRTA